MNQRYALVASLSAVVLLTLMVCVGAGASDKGVALGGKTPGFTLLNQDGKQVSLADSAGKITVLEWVNPECPFVLAHYQQHTMTNLVKKYAPKDVVWISINSGSTTTDAYDKAWASGQGLSWNVLNDASGKVGHAYAATNTPGMYIIGKEGNLLYKGAIDNNRDGNKTGSDKVNYVDQALSEILAGKPVSVPDTKPYGCTVKYAD